MSGWLSKAEFPLALDVGENARKNSSACENASRNARENTGKNTSIFVSKMTVKTQAKCK